MESEKFQKRFCIIGAGSSGLAAAKHLKAAGIAFDVLEKSNEVGGNWYYENPNSRVYRSTHLISSKPLTQYNDFPMPASFPDFPHHTQVFDYLKSYATHFNLYDHIQFDCGVKQATRVGADHWKVELDNGESRSYQGLIVANGHNWDPRYPKYRGEFTGQTLHSGFYKSSDLFDGKRVLVVGAGNSGCDIAVEAAQRGAKAFHSVRRGYYYLPKYFGGKPADQFGEISLRLRVPLGVRRWMNTWLLGLVQGKPEDYGLPRPDHKLFETHPIINSQLFYYLGHGDLVSKPDIQELRGDRILFVDGSEEKIDVLIFATGYHLSFPFLNREDLNWTAEKPDLFLNVFHPEADDLFIVGMIQPDSGQFGLVDYQAELIAEYLKGRRNGSRKAVWFKKLKKDPKALRSSRIRYVKSSRHALEIEHFSYRRRLKKLIKNLAG